MISYESDHSIPTQDHGSVQINIPSSYAGADILSSPPALPFNVTACSSSDDSQSQPISPKPSSNHTIPRNSPADILPISISSLNANRIIEASRAFNLTLRNIQENQGIRSDVREDETVMGNESSSETDDHHASSIPDRSAVKVETAQPDQISRDSDRILNFTEQNKIPVQKLFVQAVHQSNDPLLAAFLQKMRNLRMTEVEIQTCLLLFVDMGKSSKILAGFEILAAERDAAKVHLKQTTESFHEGDGSSILITDTNRSINGSSQTNSAVLAVQISCADIETLLRCFMTSISICMDSGSKDREPESEHIPSPRPSKLPKTSSDSSPERTISRSMTSSFLDDDWNLSENVLKEIRKIASYASHQVIEHVQKKNQITSSPGIDENSFLVGFDQFGEWYNSGGFSSVPWLELLDLNKWDFERRETSIPHSSPTFTDQRNLANKSNSNTNDVTSNGRSPNLSERKTDPFATEQTSRTLVSFDFSDGSKGIKITEDNLIALKRFIQLTGLENRTAEEVLGVITRFSTPMAGPDMIAKLVLNRSDFGRCVRLIVPEEISAHFTNTDAELISLYFSNFFNCFSHGSKDISVSSDYVDSVELAIGLSFFCKGKKSVKLATTFEMLDDKKIGFLNQAKILRYLRSYLTMLAGISLLSPCTEILADRRRLKLLRPPSTLLDAASDGARWTLDHFIKSLQKSGHQQLLNEVSFETFAGWYTNGGFNYAPWLEFLDLKKFFSLLVPNDKEPNNTVPCTTATTTSETNRFLPQVQHATNKPVSLAPQPAVVTNAPQVLFSFPLANRQSLVVLNEDAAYVYSVVCNLGMVNCSPDELWRSLWRRIRSLSHIKPMKNSELDKNSFVTFLSDILADKVSVKSNVALASIKETICNFYLSFDLDQKNRVAANQLMGGLTLLCNGKKSTKLSFSFGLFDGSNDDVDKSSKNPSLDGRELFYFLRSYLIVMFSCCKQSLHLSSAEVAQNISDTAYTVTDNVMRYQWRNKCKSRVDFEEFGDWYNQGGFETAPWLELLDLNKWVLKDKIKSESSKTSPSSFPNSSSSVIHLKEKNCDWTNMQSHIPTDTQCPPPPPDDQFDPNTDDFFGDHIAIDGIDDYDFDFNDISDGMVNESIGQINIPKAITSSTSGNPLNFQILSGQDNGGFLINVSSQRVSFLRRILSDGQICHLDVSAVCNTVLSKASNKKLTKENFIAATRSFPLTHGTPEYCKRVLNELFSAIFDAFDNKQIGKVDAKVLACGCAVICNGRKSDKLEYTFDLLEKGQTGLNQADLMRYLESFLNVLLTIASCSLDGERSETIVSFINSGSRKSVVPPLSKVSHIGCSWATTQVFSSEYVRRTGSDRISFETFASWYTQGGHTSIQWLELLDLRKWILADGR